MKLPAMKPRTLLRFVLFLLFAAPALPALAQQEAGDSALRQKLAERMQEIQPVADQVALIVGDLAEREPESARVAFKEKMMAGVDAAALSKAAAAAMAETFTAAELQRMIDYFGSPEAKTIDEKMPVFHGLLQPAVSKAIDRALMAVRTGAPADAP